MVWYGVASCIPLIAHGLHRGGTCLVFTGKDALAAALDRTGLNMARHEEL